MFVIGSRFTVAPEADPTPLTVEGTHALVERWHALRRMVLMGQVGVGGPAGSTRVTSLSVLPTKKPKRSVDA